MGFKKIDSVVDTFVKNNSLRIDTLPMVVDYSKQILNKTSLSFKDGWSREIELNDSIKNVYKFLLTLDGELANQFYNILMSKDENDKPYVNLLPRDKHPEGKNEVKDGRIYIYYDNTPLDMFTILHEMLHKMNECKILEDELNTETFARDYFGETVSILGELMLGEYLVNEGIITKEDFDKRKNLRLNNSKEAARDILIENELIELKLQGKEITYENLIEMFNTFDKTTSEYFVFADEKYDGSRLKDINRDGKLRTPVSQRYVIGYFLSNILSRRETLEEDFIKLHTAIGDPEANINNVYYDIIVKEVHENKK